MASALSRCCSQWVMCNLGWIVVSCDPGNLSLVETGSIWDVWASGSPAVRRQDKVHFPQTQREILEDNPMGGCRCSCDSPGSIYFLPVPTTLPVPGRLCSQGGPNSKTGVSEEVGVLQFYGKRKGRVWLSSSDAWGCLLLCATAVKAALQSLVPG